MQVLTGSSLFFKMILRYLILRATIDHVARALAALIQAFGRGFYTACPYGDYCAGGRCDVSGSANTER